MTAKEYLIQRIETFLQSHESSYWVLELDKDELQIIIKALKGDKNIGDQDSENRPA